MYQLGGEKRLKRLKVALSDITEEEKEKHPMCTLKIEIKEARNVHSSAKVDAYFADTKAFREGCNINPETEQSIAPETEAIHEYEEQLEKDQASAVSPAKRHSGVYTKKGKRCTKKKGTLRKGNHRNGRVK